MTMDQIWDWQCRMFVYSSYLYEVESAPILTDAHFDQHCAMLLRNYDVLPQWFRDRVGKSQLEAGTALGLTYAQDDIDGAHRWVEQTERDGTQNASREKV